MMISRPCVNMNKNVKKTKVRRMERVRRTNQHIGWSVTRDSGNALAKYVQSSFRNKKFLEETFKNDIDSINKGYIQSLKSQKVSTVNKTYINVWNTTINTLKNIHKHRKGRKNDIYQNVCLENTLNSTNYSKCLGTLNILDMTAKYHSK
jgi:hypothetical protein